MNPLFNSMGGNMNMLLGMLQQRNPQGYQMYMNLVNSGKNPNQILNSMMSNMNEQQKNFIREMGNQYKIK